MRLLLTSTGLLNRDIENFFVSKLPKEPGQCSVLMVAYVQNKEEQYYVEKKHWRI